MAPSVADRSLALALGARHLAACSRSTSSSGGSAPSPDGAAPPTAPSPDPRVGLRAGLMDAGEAVWNLRVVSKTPPPEQFVGSHQLRPRLHSATTPSRATTTATRSGTSRIRAKPTLKTAYVCPASQSDVSVYRNLLFVSGEDLAGRLDCGDPGRAGHGQHGPAARASASSTSPTSPTRGTSATCRPAAARTPTRCWWTRRTRRTSTSTSRARPRVRSPSELPGCVGAHARQGSRTRRCSGSRSSRCRWPTRSRRRSSARRGSSTTWRRRRRTARRRRTSPPTRRTLAEAKAARRVHRDDRGRGAGHPAAVHGDACSTASSRRAAAPARRPPPTARRCGRRCQAIVDAMVRPTRPRMPDRNAGPTQCHDITVYPAIGLAGGACGGYGLLLDISDPANPTRIGAVADSNFSYWHSATFNNDGTKILFSDEWGGGGQPKCRATDKKEWGADAIFTIDDRQDGVPELLQDAGAADAAGELRGAQRLADPDPGARRDGAGVVSGRHLGVRLDRPGAPEGDRLLRPRPGGLDRAWATAGRGRSTGTTASSSAPRSRAGSTSSS